VKSGTRENDWKSAMDTDAIATSEFWELSEVQSARPVAWQPATGIQLNSNEELLDTVESRELFWSCVPGDWAYRWQFHPIAFALILPLLTTQSDWLPISAASDVLRGFVDSCKTLSHDARTTAADMLMKATNRWRYVDDAGMSRLINSSTRSSSCSFETRLFAEIGNVLLRREIKLDDCAAMTLATGMPSRQLRDNFVDFHDLEVWYNAARNDGDIACADRIMTIINALSN